MDISNFSFNILAWFSVFIFVFGSLLNGLMCGALLKNRSFYTKENILLLSMAISDLLCCLIAMPTSMISNFYKKWIFHDSGCKCHAFIVTWCGIVSITHLAALAFYRYQDIKFKRNQFMSVRKTLYVVFALWIYSFIFAIAPVAGWSRYSKEGIGTSCSVDWQETDIQSVSYTIFIFLGAFVAPVAVIVFSYFRLYMEIRSMVQNANTMWGKMSHQAKMSLRSKRKMAILFLIMIVAFLLSWTPYSVVSLIVASGRPHWIGPVAASVPAYFAKSSIVYNPVIYFLMFRRFRVKVLALLAVICCTRRKKKTDNTLHLSQREKTERENLQEKTK